MKRSPYDSEYERVRQKRPARSTPVEFEGFDDPKPPEPERNFASDLSEDFRERMAVLAEHEAKRVAEMKIRVDAKRAEFSKRRIAEEYARCGVQPPYTNEDGTAKFSLPFLLRLGWHIETYIEGQNTLVHPRGIAHAKEG